MLEIEDAGREIERHRDGEIAEQAETIIAQTKPRLRKPPYFVEE